MPCLLRAFQPFTFVPLVSAEMNVIAELSITILGPEAPGSLLTQGGDLDNRIKTLLDALTMPQHANALAVDTVPGEDELPFFYSLLEDDNLVTAVSVRTEQLLEPTDDESLVEVLINVRTRVTRESWKNMIFA